MEPSADAAGPEPVCPCLAWGAEEVAQWVVQLGFPQYEECFRANGITGRRLILVNCSSLPAIGVQDFGHMQVLAGAGPGAPSSGTRSPALALSACKQARLQPVHRGRWLIRGASLKLANRIHSAKHSYVLSLFRRFHDTCESC
ncbi:sterile alpha motif domain-containing protein 15 isoform X3 [Strigops habroptila]|uniref:sterile alpha motif domain-containing protein 15 isoform X3 n=1 Tax=Strigops habroptila TaxID=2489341 RepID=UPI0011CF6F81|nr:sterile alpha motif domain-containing protein 15 isoform X3 [Strigops habroptila]